MKTHRTILPMMIILRARAREGEKRTTTIGPTGLQVTVRGRAADLADAIALETLVREFRADHPKLPARAAEREMTRQAKAIADSWSKRSDTDRAAAHAVMTRFGQVARGGMADEPTDSITHAITNGI